ncbi:MAG: yidA 2 [Firmicutes bacterium]|nr:yidA 2 [Bacillota bacterium]
MAIKLIALDLDDTLLDKSKTISARNRRAIERAIEAGVTVTVSTGRMYQSALPYVLELGLDVPIITYNGALIKWGKSGETLFDLPVDRATTREMLALFKEHDWYLQAYIDDQLYVAQANEYSDYYKRMTGIAAIALGDAFYTLEGTPSKMMAIADSVLLTRIREKVNEVFGPRVNLAVSGPRYLEIVNPMVSKGRALALLAKHLGITREQVMAVGDSQNDLPMLQYAGWGVAMANAMPEVQAAADAVTSANDVDGVAEAIEKYVLGNISK